MPQILWPPFLIAGEVYRNAMSPVCESFSVDPYRLFYSADESDVVVLGVLHQRREFDRWGRKGSTSDAL